MAFPQFINNLGGIIGPIGFLTASVFGTLYGRNKATIAALEESTTAYEKVIAARNLEHGENQKRIMVLEQKADILENQVTQAPSISELATQLAAQHSQMIKEMGKMTVELGNIAKSITKKEA